MVDVLSLAKDKKLPRQFRYLIKPAKRQCLQLKVMALVVIVGMFVGIFTVENHPRVAMVAMGGALVYVLGSLFYYLFWGYRSSQELIRFVNNYTKALALLECRAGRFVGMSEDEQRALVVADLRQQMVEAPERVAYRYRIYAALKLVSGGHERFFAK